MNAIRGTSRSQIGTVGANSRGVRSAGQASRPQPSATVGIRIGVRPGATEIRTWDRLVSETPNSDVTQLSAWSGVRRQAGFDSLYLLCSHNGTLLGGAQILRRRLPVLGWLGYVAYGPVVAPTARRAEVVEALCAAMADVDRLGLRALFVQPADGDDDIHQKLVKRGFRASEADIAPGASIRVDLALDEQVLFANLGKKIRRWARRWPDHDVSVRLGNETDIPVLAELIARTGQHHGFEPLSEDYLRSMYRHLEPGGHVQIFVGELGGEAVCAQLFTSCGGVLKSRLTALDRSGQATELRVAHAVKWAAINWARTNDYRWFDVGGIKSVTADAVLSGGPVDHSALPSRDQFKLGLGGTAFRYPPAVELIAPAIVRHCYDLSRRSTVGRDLLARAERLMRHGRTKHRASPSLHSATEQRAQLSPRPWAEEPT